MAREEVPEPGAHIVRLGSRVRYRARDAESQVMGRHEGDEVEVQLHPKLPMLRATIEAIE